jgi:hypothetical protein
MSAGFRVMTAADVNAVAELEGVLFPIDAWPRQMFVDELAQASRHYLVAEDRDEIVGYAGLMCLPPVRRCADHRSSAGFRRAGHRHCLADRVVGRSQPPGRHRGAVGSPGRQSQSAAALPAIRVRTDSSAAALLPRRRGRPGDAGAVGSTSMMPLVLGIESSCDETGVGIVRGTQLLANTVSSSSMAEHVRFGGVIPEIASRAHLDAIVPTLNEALATAGVGLADIDAIAVTAGPGLAGALMVGVCAAKALALATGKTALRGQPPGRARRSRALGFRARQPASGKPRRAPGLRRAHRNPPGPQPHRGCRVARRDDRRRRRRGFRQNRPDPRLGLSRRAGDRPIGP